MKIKMNTRSFCQQGLLAGAVLTALSLPLQATDKDTEQHDAMTGATKKSGHAFDGMNPEMLKMIGRDPAFHPSQYYAGGKNGTVFNATSRALEQPSPAIIRSRDLTASFDAGEALFEANYVIDSESPNGGLGPAYNKNSCISCHPNYGRSRQQTKFSAEYGNGYIALVHTPDGKVVKGYTFMLQTKAVPPHKPTAEGVDITWHNFVDKYSNRYPDGTAYNEGNKYEGTLVYPTAKLVNPLIPVPDDAIVSIEGTIGLFGTGLLDAIPDEDIIKEYEQQQKLPGPIKGTHGRWITESYDGKKHLGKFTWHTTRSSLQNGPGFNGMFSVPNITRKDRPNLFTTKEWIAAQGELGIDTETLTKVQPEEMTLADRDNLMLWSRGLAVPAPRGLENPTVQKGQALFHSIGCSQCHRPDWKTGEYSYVPGYSNQRIWPYTDMLKHDMGEENAGLTRTYRTPPLWGRGIMYNVVDHTDMFHDLRARNFEEAILWHFGESTSTREKYRTLPKAERKALIKFLEAL